uniref:IST1 homolog n=1 Tax=Petromyzon marinus TaxID=7757 RepID=S4RRI6_PETMA
MFGSGYKGERLRVNLRLVINRLKLLQKKKTELAQKARKEIADYLGSGKDERARIRVEHIIREDYLVEAMEILELLCDLLLARFGLIQSMKEMDPGLEEAISTLIWAAPRLQVEVQELKVVSDQLCAKYSKEYGKLCRTNQTGTVNERLMHKLGVEAPPKMLVERYLIEIAKNYNVAFEPDAIVLGEVPIADEADLIGVYGNVDDYNGGGGGGGGGGCVGPLPFGNAAMPPPLPSGMHPNMMPIPTMPTIPTVPPVTPFSYPPGNSQFLCVHTAPMPGGFPVFPGAPVAQPPPAYDNLAPHLDLPDLPTVPDSLPQPAPRRRPPNSSGPPPPSDEVDFDDLTRRFEELKKKK